MVIPAVGFRPNTALADGKIELFRNEFLGRQETRNIYPRRLRSRVTVRLFATTLKDTSYIGLGSKRCSNSVSLVHITLGGHELEGIMSASKRLAAHENEGFIPTVTRHGGES